MAIAGSTVNNVISLLIECTHDRFLKQQFLEFNTSNQATE